MKKFSYLFASLVLAFSVPYKVNALTDVECITSAGSHECTLSGDVVVNDSLRVQGDIVLDLNGHTIRPADNATFNAGVVGVLRGGKLTVKDTAGNGKITTGNTTVAAGLQVTLYGESADGDAATLILESGTIEGKYFGITGNGTRHNTNITINGGTVRAINGTGVYHPQYGTITVNGGTITGETGIEMRSGNLVVNGGEIVGTATPTSVTANGNGTTTLGAGIAIAQHTTLKDISVAINDGTVKGYSAVYESNPQGNGNVANQVSVSIDGGNFEAINGGAVAVYSQDLTNFVTKGSFNKALDSSYVSNEIEVKEVNGVYLIGDATYPGENKNSEVLYTVPETFTWSVSSSVKVEETLTISVADANCNVKVDLTSSQNGFKVKSGNNSADYLLKNGNTTLTANTTVITTSSSDSKELAVVWKDSAPTKAGRYTDLLTFTASVVE